MSDYKDKPRQAWNGEIGPFLKEAREERGLSLKEAEQSTKIRSRYLEGLEREAANELPRKSYVQGFLESYAEFLGLDVEEFGHRFKRHSIRRRKRREQPDYSEKSLMKGVGGSGSDESETPDTGSLLRNSRGSSFLVLSLAVLILALIVSGFYLLRGGSLMFESPVADQGAPKGDVPGEAEPNEAPQAEGGVDVAPTLEGEPEVASGGEGRLRATVLVRGAESWISVESDAGVEYTGIAQPGFSRSFEPGRSFRITTGNAGAVELRINGIDYGSLGENGEVTSRSFTFKRER